MHFYLHYKQQIYGCNVISRTCLEWHMTLFVTPLCMSSKNTKPYLCCTLLGHRFLQVKYPTTSKNDCPLHKVSKLTQHLNINKSFVNINVECTNNKVFFYKQHKQTVQIFTLLILFSFLGVVATTISRLLLP